MNARQRLWLFIAVILLFGVLCSDTPVRSEDKMGVTALVEGNTAFALNLYKKLRTAENNLFFSPYSISTAIAMTYAGARGNTARQISEVLHFTPEQKRLHEAFGHLENSMKALQETEGIEMRVANALWAEKDYPFLAEFLRLVTENYRAELSYADFKRASESARQEINAWVEQQTNQKIKDLIKQGALNSLTRLVLANAIYFKGFWAEQFAKSATKNDKFWITSDTTVDLPMMTQQNEFRYMENTDIQILELPYVGEEMSMVIMLPKSIDGLAQIENSLTVENLKTFLLGLQKREVIVYLPRFKLTSDFGLGEILASLGMPDAFRPTIADFSGMDGTRMLYISAVVHKAFVDVNEEGTEAAAATGVVMTLAAAPVEPTVFRADHPFVFFIRHNCSGSILFLGKLVNPAK
jgi:serine protease inhibitor